GTQTRSFQYIDDLVEGMIRLMASSDKITGPINIGNPNEFTMIELAQKILQKTKSKSKIIFKPLPSDDPKQRQPDITKAYELLDKWQPTTQLDEGLQKTITYFANKINE
ncbi:MAG: GDP-mannose 4,6-dehydratase, partial [Bacteroidales bacterium]